MATTIIDRVTSEQKYKANGDWQSLRLALTNLKESQRSIPAWSQAVMSVHHVAALLFEYSVQTGFPSSVKSYNETLNFKDLLIDNVPTTFVFCVFRQDLINRLVVALSNNDECIVTLTREAKALGLKRRAPLFKAKDIVERYDMTVV